MIVRAGNMSVGVNLLTVLARRVAAVLGPEYDIEIVEMHHRAKVDAPSGTALMLGEAAAAGRRVNLADAAERGRDGVTGRAGRGRDRLRQPARRRRRRRARDHLRRAGRAGGAAHVATDRMLFARGAVRAALWGQDQEPGQYSMIDVLGLRDPDAEVPDR